MLGGRLFLDDAARSRPDHNHQKQNTGNQRSYKNNGGRWIIIVHRFFANFLDGSKSQQPHGNGHKHERDQYDDRTPEGNHTEDLWQDRREAAPRIRRD